MELKDIHRVFTPSGPIRSNQYLRGRDEELEQVLGSLETPGRSVFIFGERGVGKTSLAQTAAQLFNSSDSDPAIIACQAGTTFERLMSQVVRKLGATNSKVRKVTTEYSVNAGAFKLMKRIEEGEKGVVDGLDVNDAIDLLNEFAATLPKGHQAVVIIDEMEELSDSTNTRQSIAYLVKQLGDQGCPIKFIFAGIAEDATNLLANHKSAFRYVATRRLTKLPVNVLADIVTEGFRELGSHTTDAIALRIACISDGFAYFTHLICTKMAVVVRQTRSEGAYRKEYEAALEQATEDSAVELKEAYDVAIQKYKNRYEPVLWSAADHWETDRSIGDMFESYQMIMKVLEREAVDQNTFGGLLRNLASDAHGNALNSHRRGWYRFSRNMLRGYCRLRAHAARVDLGVDYLDPKDKSRILESF